MPFDPKMKKPPVLTDAQSAAAETAYLDDVAREIVIEGHDPKSTEMRTLLAAARERLTVRSTMMGPNVQYFDQDAGYSRTARDAAMALIAQHERRTSLLAFGPDPEQVLVDRLVSVGVPSEEAKQRARHRIARREDGRVDVDLRGDQPHRTFRLPPEKSREYTAEQLAEIRDHRPAVAAATRAILEERENGLDAMGRPANYQPTDRTAELQRMVRGGF